MIKVPLGPRCRYFPQGYSTAQSGGTHPSSNEHHFNPDAAPHRHPQPLLGQMLFTVRTASRPTDALWVARPRSLFCRRWYFCRSQTCWCSTSTRLDLESINALGTFALQPSRERASSSHRHQEHDGGRWHPRLWTARRACPPTSRASSRVRRFSCPHLNLSGASPLGLPLHALSRAARPGALRSGVAAARHLLARRLGRRAWDSF